MFMVASLLVAQTRAQDNSTESDNTTTTQAPAVTAAPNPPATTTGGPQSFTVVSLTTALLAGVLVQVVTRSFVA